MAPRQEILDSEDDGSDFGDGPQFGETETHETEVPQETIGASHTAAGTDSTDPSFFQRIYNQQQHAAAGMQDVIPDTAPPGPAASTWTDISSAPPPGGQKQPQAKGSSSLTSVTDPVPASRKAKRARQVHQSEVIDLTDITTPRKEAAASGTSDPWDVPPPSPRSQRTTRTYGKRQQLSLEQEEALPSTMLDTQDPYAFPDATPPTRQNTRRGTPSSSARHAPQDSSPVMMLVPTEEAASSEKRTRSSRKKKKEASFGGIGGMESSSSLADTAVPPSLYVSQSSLTASQRQEYQVVSLSSEAVPEVPDEEMSSPLAGQALGVGMGEMYKSSGATTIAYPTPSRAASSRRRLPGVVEEGEGEGEGDGGVAGASLGYDVGYQQSSPDVLTDMTTATASRSKRSRTKVVSSAGLDASELETPASTRRAKKRKVVREVEDEVWELDPLGRTQENNDAPQQDTQNEGEGGDAAHTAQPELSVDGQASVPEVETLNVEATEAPIAIPKPAPKGKRGRKKKGPKTQEPAPELEEPIQTAEAEPELAPEPSEATEPPGKRKRGRPCKSGTAKPQPEPEYEPSQQHTDEAQAEVETDTAPQPLSELDHNSQPSAAVATKEGGGDAIGDTKENELPAAKEAAVKEKPTEKEKPAKDVKSGALKVQYRVGLSKRSRIAPLLKCLKKPA
ncbi:hypothetical protein C8A01DRAFT_15569 [Parachaetomium inaequale]|uniref:AT hook domain-containing protein n=1 Tax=Parachaetomium inaequale TaxID=2588326 RepID=A0AAN6SRM5_9PEZI|nr:hypothetical protein C8A01DRAFT_15569 [Parachaetomium inaequale]